MHTVELYRKVRLACRDGMSERAAALHFGISRESVKKMLRFSVPPGYRRTAPVRRPKLDGFSEIIDQWLKEDLKQLRKQRHTAKRIFDRLRAEHGFSGGYTIVKDYVREHHRRRREMFVPLIHPPGHGQADFGEARAVIGCGGEVIARHPRSYEREDTIFEPIHYLPLIEQKIGALDQAAPLAGWELPPAFQTLRRLMEARSPKAGRRGVCAGPAAAGELRAGGSRRRREGRPAPGRHRLRRGQASGAVPGREAPAEAGVSGILCFGP